MSDQWFWAVNRQKTGPYLLAQLQAFVSEGRLRPTDMLLPTDAAKWVEAKTVAGLFPVAPPPLPVSFAAREEILEVILEVVPAAEPPSSPFVWDSVDNEGLSFQEHQRRELRLIAARQRRLILFIGLGILIGVAFGILRATLTAGDAAPPVRPAGENAPLVLLSLFLFLAISLALSVIQLWLLLSLASALQLEPIWLWGLGCFLPLVGFVLLLVVNQKATNVLTKAGVRVGFLGASEDDFPLDWK